MTRILVVEDSPTQLETTLAALELHGFEVLAAKDGESGLEIATRSRPDIVVSDVVMPGMSGYELCKALKGGAATRHIPVVLLTALNDPLDVIRGLACGAQGFVTKPFEPSHLVGRIQTILENCALRAARDPGSPAEIVFQGQRVVVSSEREQILDLLTATFEDAVHTNRELAAKQAELLRVQKQKEELATLLVHDLKSPLNGVFLLLRSLRRSPRLGDDERESVELIRAACDSMLRMVVNLLDISRAEDGRLRPALTRVDLSNVIDDLTHEAGTRGHDRAVRFEVAIEPGARTLTADPDLLRRVLENLIDNSLKHAPDESTIRVEARADEGEIAIRVRDQGRGVSPEYREKIFEKYVQIEGSKEGARASRGLGLVFCRLAVEAHGGRIWVEPNEPQGSCFCVRLPRG